MSTEPEPRIDELRTDVAATRADLGETVAALADKADVKARAAEAAGQARQNLKEGAQRAADKARQTVQGGTARAATQARDAGSTVVRQGAQAGDAARRNPGRAGAVLAAVLAALAAVVWLRRRRRS